MFSLLSLETPRFFSARKVGLQPALLHGLILSPQDFALVSAELHEVFDSSFLHSLDSPLNGPTCQHIAVCQSRPRQPTNFCFLRTPSVPQALGNVLNIVISVSCLHFGREQMGCLLLDCRYNSYRCTRGQHVTGESGTGVITYTAAVPGIKMIWD